MDIVAATRLAQAIVHRRKQLNDDKAEHVIHPSHSKSRMMMTQEESMIKGMVVALSIVIDKQNDIRATEIFIAENTR